MSYIVNFYFSVFQCLKQILRAFSLEKKERITVTDFIYMSSAIIYHLDVQNCSQVTHNFLSSMGSVVDMSHNHLNLGHDHDLDHDHVHDHDLGHQVTPDLGQASSESTSLVSTHPEKGKSIASVCLHYFCKCFI